MKESKLDFFKLSTQLSVSILIEFSERSHLKKRYLKISLTKIVLLSFENQRSFHAKTSNSDNNERRNIVRCNKTHP